MVKISFQFFFREHDFVRMGLLLHMKFAEQRVVGNGPQQAVNVEIRSVGKCYGL